MNVLPSTGGELECYPFFVPEAVEPLVEDSANRVRDRGRLAEVLRDSRELLREQWIPLCGLGDPRPNGDRGAERLEEPLGVGPGERWGRS